MNKTIEQWAACDPSLMARMSEAAITYAFLDAKADISQLSAKNDNLVSLLVSLTLWIDSLSVQTDTNAIDILRTHRRGHSSAPEAARAAIAKATGSAK